MVSIVDAQREILLDPIGTNVWVSIFVWLYGFVSYTNYSVWTICPKPE